MKKFIYFKTMLLAVTLLVGSVSAWGQIAAWDFTGVGTTSLPTYAATSFNSNLVSTSGANYISRGSTAAWSTGGNSFRTAGFKNEGISTSNTDYFQITLAPATGYALSLSTIDAKFTGTDTYCASPGVSNQFAYSLDGTNFTLIGSPQALIGTPATLTQIDISSITALQNVASGTTVTLRYYASGQTTTGGWGFLSAASAGTNGLAIGGTVTSTATITNYYSKSTGNLDILSNWGTSTDGSGTAPTDFTSDNQIFNIRNNATPTIGGNWTVSGTNSKIIVGDGTNACNFTIPSSFAVNGTIDVTANATLTKSNSTNPTFGTLDANSTISFTGTSAQTIPAATYGNLSISTTGGNATAGGTIGITTSLTVSSGSVFDMSTNALTGSGLTTNGTGTLRTQNTTSTPIPTGKTWSMDVEYNGTGAQTIVTGIYNNLILSGARTGSPAITLGSGTITIGGAFSVTSTGIGSYTVTGNTVDFSSSSSQTIPAISYNTITNSGNGARTFPSTGTVSIAGTFTTGNGAYTLGTSTVQFNGSGQTIPKTNTSGAWYYNLVVAGSGIARFGASGPILASGGNLTINSGATLNMGTVATLTSATTQMTTDAGTGTVTINGTLNTANTAGLMGTTSTTFHNTGFPVNNITIGASSTINFCGGSNQTVSAGSYANLTISQARSTSTLTLQSGTINISGVFSYTATGTPTFTTTGNTIVYNGSGSQAIAAIPYNNLTINNSTGATIDQNITVSGALSVISGSTLTVSAGKQLTVSTTLTNNGTLNLLSSPSGTATILTPGTIGGTGTASVQQYLSSARNWYVSSPVSNALAPSGYTYYNYNEAGSNWVGSVTSFAKGVGYIALPDLAGSTLTFTTQPGGTLNTGNVDITLTKSGPTKTGFNLIGNPYPAHLTWTKTFVNNNSTRIEPTIWYRTNAGTVNSGGDASWSFLTYNAVSEEGTPTTANGIVPPMQAFWVRAVSPGTSTLTLNSDLTLSHQASNPLKAPAVKSSDRQRLRLQVNNGTSTDETLIYFDANASNGYDRYDSPKFEDATTVTQIYTTAVTEKLVINGMNSIPLDTEIGLGFVPGNATSFSIMANEISNLPSDVKVILKDNVTLAETDLTNGVNTYEFSPATTTTNRFSVIFRTAGAVTGIPTAANEQNLLVYRNANNQIAVQIKGQLNDFYSLDVYNSVGQKLASKQATAGITIMDAPQSGVYFVTIKGNGNNTTKKVVIN